MRIQLPGTHRRRTLAPSYRGRFAPSPTGPLHFGSLFAALGSWLLARHAGGEWRVRIEDLDPPREMRGAATQQLRTLRAFGLSHDAPVTWQSERSALYQQALDQLLERGLAFHCRCSRSDLAAVGGIHRRCVTSARGRRSAVRLRVADGARVSFVDGLQGAVQQDVDREVGDFVLRRSDGLWAYQLAVVVDDAAQAMTDIVRGADLLGSTPRQILLQHALGLPTPRYLHLPVIVDGQGHKLAKSAAAPALDCSNPLPALQAAWAGLGQDADALAATAGSHEALHAALHGFQPGRLPRAASIPVAALHNAADVNAV